jgi:hypothetical protein
LRSGEVKSANPEIGPSHVTKGDIFDELGFSSEETLEADEGDAASVTP